MGNPVYSNDPEILAKGNGSADQQTNDQLLTGDVDETAGVEAEPDDPSIIEIERPFNPEKIKVRTVNIVVEQLVSRISHNEIDLAPEFQRMRGIWSVGRKSRLIESLLLRIPIPYSTFLQITKIIGRLLTACSECRQYMTLSPANLRLVD